MPDLILIVEDDVDLAEATAMILELNGFSTMIAYNGSEALAMLETATPSLIVLDMMMPIMNGWEFAHELDERHGRIAPILVVSAAADALAFGEEVNAAGVLTKPFDASELVARVRMLIAGATRASEPAPHVTHTV